MSTSPDAHHHYHGDAVTSPPATADPAAALLISRAEMNTAYDSGQATPLGRAIPWIVRYGDSWWVEYEHGWLRITDDLTTADLDQTAARLKAADAMAAEDATFGGVPGPEPGLDASAVTAE
jgi:hypothetical protein